MKHKDGKLRDVLVVIFVTVCELVLCEATTTNGCALKYKKLVDEKPNIFLMTNGLPGICRIQLEDNSTTNYHLDKKYAEEIRPETVVGGLNYDARNNTLLYWAKIANVDHSRLYKVRLNDSHWETVLEQDDDFRDMSYDWVSKNLYVIMGGRSLMVAVNVEHPWNPSVVVNERSQLTSLAVHPNRGLLFFVETGYWFGLQHKIFRAHLDGSNVREFNRSRSDMRYYVASIVVDLHSERVYWSMLGVDRIQHSDLEGRDVRTISGVRVYSGQLDLAARALAVDKHYVYYRSAERNSVRRIEKTSEARDADYELLNDEAAPITEILTFSYKAQQRREDHPCREARGGCDKFCFAVPRDEAGAALKRVCKCSFNDVLAADGVSCVKRRPTTSAL